MFRRWTQVALALACFACAAPRTSWRSELDSTLDRFGHRNVIAVVDSAYPEQASDSIRVVATGADQLELLRAVLAAIDEAGHVRAKVQLDRELDFVGEAVAPGITAYRSELVEVLGDVPVERVEHERIIAALQEASQHFDVLVLKSTLRLPYTSVFVTLDCGYWSDGAEERLRQAIRDETSRGFLR